MHLFKWLFDEYVFCFVSDVCVGVNGATISSDGESLERHTEKPLRELRKQGGVTFALLLDWL